MPLIRSPILVCSLGNPGFAYANTLHSAGHVALRAVQANMPMEPWRPHIGGEISTSSPVRKFSLLEGYTNKRPADDDVTLWISGSMMNLSGAAVKKVWTRWKAERDTRKEGKLIIIHDDLDNDLGKVKVKTDGKLSAK
jgi:PTH1 family peptidyl-tRNA hydrolase